MAETAIIIRASSAPGYNDCARRTATNIIPEIIKDAGFALAQRQPNISGSVGTAVHKATAYMLNRKKSQESMSLNDAIEIGIGSLHEDLKHSPAFDGTTPNQNTAESQVKDITKIYQTGVLDSLAPDLIEEEFDHTIDETDYSFKIVGHPDLITLDPILHDTKTSRSASSYHAQLGTYILTWQHIPKKVIINWIPRTSKKKPLPMPQAIEYDVKTCVGIAKTTLKRMRSEITAFFKSGNADTFTANPMSNLCSPKYCSAYGTKFCKIHKGAK